MKVLQEIPISFRFVRMDCGDFFRSEDGSWLKLDPELQAWVVVDSVKKESYEKVFREYMDSTYYIPYA